MEKTFYDITVVRYDVPNWAIALGVIIGVGLIVALIAFSRKRSS
jgi:hypothetical protein